MRAALFALVVVAGCTDSAVDEDVTYRRLRDQFTSYDQCLAEGNFTPCYQTLTLCPDQRTRIDLNNAPQRGSYTLNDSEAVMTFTVMGTIHFDLESASSPELPGVHDWERIDPISHGCD
jgi:hypothetical protein